MAQYVADTLRRGQSGLGAFAIAEFSDLKLSDTIAIDLTDRDNFPTWRRTSFMSCYVISEDKIYRLGADVTIPGQIWTEVIYSDPDALVHDDVFGTDGFIKPELLRNLFINDSFVVDSEIAMLAVSSVTGNVFVRTDTGHVFLKLNNDDPSDISDFADITANTGAVTSVNGMTGSVSITIANLLSNPTNLTDFNAAVASNALVISHSASIASLTTNKADLVSGKVPLSQLPYVFDNGLSTTGSEVKLGGVLLYDTEIVLDAFNFKFNNTGAGQFGLDLGSDVEGDLFYRGSDGYLKRLPIGADGQFLKVSGTSLIYGSGGGGGGGGDFWPLNGPATLLGDVTINGGNHGIEISIPYDFSSENIFEIQSYRTDDANINTGLRIDPQSGSYSNLLYNNEDDIQSAVEVLAGGVEMRWRDVSIPISNSLYVGSSGVMISAPQGGFTVTDFAGSGNRIVISDSAGKLGVQNILTGALGGTGVANTGKTITISGNTSIGSSAHTVSFLTSGNTSITLPASGTIATLSGSETFTNKTLTSPVINFGSDADGDILARVSGAYARLAKGSNGTFLGVSSGILGYYSPPSGSGTVTSVDASGGTTGLSFSGGPITGSGTLTLSGTLTAVNGGTGIATYAQGDLIYSSATNTLSKLAKNITATRYISNTGTTNNPAWSQVDLTNGVTGRLPFANLAQITALSVFGVTGGSTADGASIAGTADQILRINGAASALAFGSIDLSKTAAVGTSVLPIANGGTASATQNFVDISTNQASIAGNKTWTGLPTFTPTVTTGNGLVVSSASGLTTGNIVSLSSITTAINGGSVLNVAISGTNANSARTTIAATFSATNTGTTSVNVAGLFTASGGATNKAISINNGIFEHVRTADFSSTVTMQSVLNNTNVEIFNLTNTGIPTWNVYNSSNAKLGDASFNTPGGTIGIILRNSNATGRYDIAFVNATSQLYILNNTSAISTKVIIGSNGTASATLHTVGRGTTTGANLRIANSADTAAFTVNDQGDAVLTKTFVVGGTTITSGSVGFDFQSTTLGMMMPRVTNIASVSTPVAGMIAYDAATNKFNFRESTSWIQLGGITNGAANNELPKSNGTNLVASGLFSSATGTISTSASSLTLEAGGANSLVFKANGNIVAGVSFVGRIFINAVAGVARIGGNDVGGSSTDNITFASGDVLSGNGNSGDVIIATGSPLGTGIKGLVKIQGTNTNSSASAGDVGEEINSTISAYANYTTTATYQNITSITLTPGDWDLSAFFTHSTNSATVSGGSNAIFVISTTTASATGATEGINLAYVSQSAFGSSKSSGAIPRYRISITGSTTYYLNTQATFTVGNPQYVGGLRARRMR